MKKINASIIVVLLSLTSVFAVATEQSELPRLPAPAQTTKSVFRNIIDQAEKACGSFACEQTGVTVIQLTHYQITEMNPFVLQKLLAQANAIADIEWADTILEGPYVAAFKIGLQEVDLLYKNDQLIGYHTVYADQAWKTTTCNYQPKDPTSLDKCIPGEFIETEFTSADLSEYFRDPMAMVQFVPSLNSASALEFSVDY